MLEKNKAQHFVHLPVILFYSSTVSKYQQSVSPDSNSARATFEITVNIRVSEKQFQAIVSVKY